MVLYEFLSNYRTELIADCGGKVAKRYSPSVVPPAIGKAIPLFLDQLIQTLEAEQLTAVRVAHVPDPSPVDTAIGRSAALHGTELLRHGYTVDQVVHHYGDLCQAVTDLAVQKAAVITTDEFRTLNRCLDEAIADAVTAFTDEREEKILDRATDLHSRLGRMGDDQRHLIDLAIQTLVAIQGGRVGASGATGAALMSTLQELRALSENTLPEIRLLSGMTSSAAKKQP